MGVGAAASFHSRHKWSDGCDSARRHSTRPLLLLTGERAGMAVASRHIGTTAGKADDAGEAVAPAATALASSSSAAAASVVVPKPSRLEGDVLRPTKRARPLDGAVNFDPTARASLPRSVADRASQRRLYIVLEQACLETVKTKSGYELLNCDDHLSLHKRFSRDPADSRPDIAHQLLLTLLDRRVHDPLQVCIAKPPLGYLCTITIEYPLPLPVPLASRSPLNKAGRLQVFMKTRLNVLVQVNPQIRLPRTFKRFSGLMVQLLHKMKIRAVAPPAAAGSAATGVDKSPGQVATPSGRTLLKVVKNPVTAHLPPGAAIYG